MLPSCWTFPVTSGSVGVNGSKNSWCPWGSLPDTGMCQLLPQPPLGLEKRRAAYSAKPSPSNKFFCKYHPLGFRRQDQEWLWGYLLVF